MNRVDKAELDAAVHILNSLLDQNSGLEDRPLPCPDNTLQCRRECTQLKVQLEGNAKRIQQNLSTVISIMSRLEEECRTSRKGARQKELLYEFQKIEEDIELSNLTARARIILTNLEARQDDCEAVIAGSFVTEVEARKEPERVPTIASPIETWRVESPARFCRSAMDTSGKKVEPPIPLPRRKKPDHIANSSHCYDYPPDAEESDNISECTEAFVVNRHLTPKKTAG